MFFPEKLCGESVTYVLTGNRNFNISPRDQHNVTQVLKLMISSKRTVLYKAFSREKCIFIDSHQVLKKQPEIIFCGLSPLSLMQSEQMLTLTGNGHSSNQ